MTCQDLDTHSQPLLCCTSQQTCDIRQNQVQSAWARLQHTQWTIHLHSSTSEQRLRHSWHPVLKLSSIFNDGLVMLLFQVIHLTVAAIQRFTTRRLQLIFRFTQTWKHICLVSCPWVSATQRRALALYSRLNTPSTPPSPSNLLLLIHQARTAYNKTTQQADGRQTPTSTQLFPFVFKPFENPVGFTY